MLTITSIMRQLVMAPSPLGKFQVVSLADHISRYLTEPFHAEGCDEMTRRHTLCEALCTELAFGPKPELKLADYDAACELLRLMFRGDAALAAHLDDDWLTYIADDTVHFSSAPLRKLSIDTEVGAACLRLILQADNLLGNLVDIRLAAQRIRIAVAEQCRIFYYG